jgi:uncharacterized protein YbcI
MAREIAQAAIAFEQQRTGHTPESANVVLSDDMLVIALHGALSPAEKALAQTPEGIAQLQEYHRQLFADASSSLQQEIEGITGVGVREASAEAEPATGKVVKVLKSGVVVQVFLLADSVGVGTWRSKDSAGGE